MQGLRSSTCNQRVEGSVHAAVMVDALNQETGGLVREAAAKEKDMRKWEEDSTPA